MLAAENGDGRRHKPFVDAEGVPERRGVGSEQVLQSE